MKRELTGRGIFVFLLSICCLLAGPALYGSDGFVSPDGKYAVAKVAVREGGDKLVLTKVRDNELVESITDQVTKLAFKVSWSPDSSAFLLDSWFGTKGRVFAVYVKSGDGFSALEVPDDKGIAFSDFERESGDLRILKWGGKSSSFELEEVSESESRRYRCEIKGGRVKTVLLGGGERTER